MKTSLAGSLQAYVCARPPAVTFFLSVIGITLAVLLVAFNIQNMDVAYDLRLKEDWINLMDLLSKQKLCTNMSENNQTSLSTPTEVARLSNATFLPVKIKHLNVNQFSWLDWKSKPIAFVGNISLKGLKKSCDAEVKESENVTLILVIPSAGSVDSLDDVTSCVHFLGPSHLFLPTSLTSGVPSFVTSEICSHLNVSEQARNFYVLQDRSEMGQTEAKTNSKVCKIEDTITLSYDPKIYRPQVQLTEAEKLKIFSNLMLGVYFLLGFICALLLIAILQGRKLLITPRHTLLPSKETL